MRASIPASLALGALVLTSGCTTFGSNINGSFKCEAPDGVCAPSIAIDDKALSEITQADANELMAPAGPYKVDDGDGGRAQMANAQGVIASQNQGYQLSIVFPAYTDVAGVTHERRAVAAAVALPGRTASSVELASRSRGRGEARGLLAAAQSAPALISMTAADDEGPALADNGAAAATAPKVAAAPATKAVDRIKADVDAKLSKRARRQAASFPSPE
jgi:conjugal transfer pilus assembly protein TraV